MALFLKIKGVPYLVEVFIAFWYHVKQTANGYQFLVVDFQYVAQT